MGLDTPLVIPIVPYNNQAPQKGNESKNKIKSGSLFIFAELQFIESRW